MGRGPPCAGAERQQNISGESRGGDKDLLMFTFMKSIALGWNGVSIQSSVQHKSDVLGRSGGEVSVVRGAGASAEIGRSVKVRVLHTKP